MDNTVIALANQKGGVGKTMSAIQIGAALTRQGKKVLLVDADPQGTMTNNLGFRPPEQLNVTLDTLIKAALQGKSVDPKTAILHHEEGLDVLPSNIQLSGSERDLVISNDRRVLSQILEPLRAEYDYTLVDCMPSLGSLSSCAGMASGSLSGVVGSSYASEDLDIYAANDYYASLESNLQRQLDTVETNHPGFDEYSYSLDEIGHNPYELTSFLTSQYPTYALSDIEQPLQVLFSAQYHLSYEEVTETRYRDSEPDEDGSTHQIPYDYRILKVSMINSTLPLAAGSILSSEQQTIYNATLSVYGNKPYLWTDPYSFSNPGNFPNYHVPGSALSDPQFAALIAEGEKYLGYPYTWGGSSPSTSFDCSGFVCWVFTHSGVHDLPRTTAQGIFDQCAPIAASDAKPGDIIFFQGTYDTPRTVTHVAIYVGDGMMLHCGNPIQYTSINTNYWQQHFYSFGRL